MQHHDMDRVPARGDAPQPPPSLNRLAAQATNHCLTGCAIGEVAGLVIATALGWSAAASIALAVLLAYAFDELPVLGLAGGRPRARLGRGVPGEPLALARGLGHARAMAQHDGR